MKPVLYRYRDSESVIKAMDGYTPGEGWTPLYDQAAIDAAVAAERERCADKVAGLAWMMENGAGECEPGERLRQAERAIRDGDPVYEWFTAATRRAPNA